MLCRRVNKLLSASAVYLASLWTCAWATVYELPADGSAVLGTDIRVKVTDQNTLPDIARRYGLGYPEIIRKEHAARGDPLPKVVPPGPNNPLGEYKMRLAVGDGTYEIHRTNNPVAVGLAVTHGSIRMYSEDVADLFALVPIGTGVWLINEPVKVAYMDGKLLMEVHPPVDGQGQTVKPDLQVMSQKLRRALGPDTAAIHWDFAREALEAATGVPAVVGLQTHLDPASGPAAPGGKAAADSGQ
jgi:L,D-transpeptidase catalytic domain